MRLQSRRALGWRLLITLLTLGLLRAAAAATAETATLAPELRGEVDAAVHETLKRTGVPSASIALVREQRLVYAQAYGDATREPRRAAGPAMRYPVGSISKEFTAAALLRLAEDGRLSLDDPAGKYVADLGAAAGVTIRQLLSHTSGIRDFWPQDYNLPEMARPVTAPEIIARWGAGALDFVPGTAWQYSNTGYTLAGLIAERVGGRALYEQLTQRIFRPLGMSSVLDVDHGTLAATDPTGYLRYALGPLRPAEKAAPGWLFAAGGLAMTASDLARWDIALMQGGMLSSASLRELTREIVLTNGAGTGYALGLDVGLRYGRRVLGHGGEINGFTAHHELYPDDGVAVVVLTNQESVNASETIADKLAELLLTHATPAAAAALAQDQRMFAALRQGTLDPALLTANGRTYFSPLALADFHASLAPLGEPSAFELQRSNTRGGFITRVYRVTCAGRKLEVVVRATRAGLIEQYTVSAE